MISSSRRRSIALGAMADRSVRRPICWSPNRGPGRMLGAFGPGGAIHRRTSVPNPFRGSHPLPAMSAAALP